MINPLILNINTKRRLDRFKTQHPRIPMYYINRSFSPAWDCTSCFESRLKVTLISFTKSEYSCTTETNPIPTHNNSITHIKLGIEELRAKMAVLEGWQRRAISIRPGSILSADRQPHEE